MRGHVCSAARRGSTRTSAAAVCLMLTAGWVSLPIEAAGQEQAVRYVGNLGGGNRGCPLNSQDIEINTQGSKINGFYLSRANTPVKFNGEISGSTFKIIRQAQDGDQSSISGELVGGNWEVRFVGAKCSYRAVLKPKT